MWTTEVFFWRPHLAFSDSLLSSYADFYTSQSGKIGPDPLREDADVEVVWKKVAGSKKSVGSILMDQSMVAGIGNIYRAEILFKVPVPAATHPLKAAQARNAVCMPRSN